MSCLRSDSKGGAANALVKRSACCCVGGIYRSLTAPCSTVSVTK